MSEQPEAVGSMDKREFDLRVREQSLRQPTYDPGGNP